MKFRLPVILAMAALTGAAMPAIAADTTDSLQQSFATPPAEARPNVRWWWFGPAVTKDELVSDMNYMKQGGIGGFEVQPTYPLALDDQYPGVKNIKFLSPEFFDLLTFTAAKAKELGLRMDLTLGSGWPYGGPMFTREEAAQTIARDAPVTVAAGQTSVDAPVYTGGRGGRGGGGGGRGGDTGVVAALLGPVTDAAAGASPYIPLTVSGRTAQLPADLHGATQVTFFVSVLAGLQQVKRPAYGAEGYIVDHYSPTSIAKFIQDVAGPEVAALGPNPAHSLFCDSLEVSGEGWSPTLLDEFKKRRGYDLTPWLPAIFDNTMPNAAAIRRDWGKTVMEMFDDNFVSTFEKFAQDHQSLFRIQAYGTPPTSLTTYAHADLDEGEQFIWKGFSDTRWAASASHLLGRAVTSSECFTWLHSPVFMAAPIDMKAESNLHFLNGVNQILMHGWPSTPPGVEYPGWRFYAAAVFNEKNPWFLVMPDITTYLARVGYILRQGQPANDVAVYLPEEDALTQFTPNNLMMAQNNGFLGRALNGDLMAQIIETGYDLDFMDDGLISQRGQVDHGTLAFGDVKYPVIILPNIQRISLETYRKFEQFANNGGILIAIGSAPTTAPGFLATDQDQQEVQAISQRLFTGPNAKGILLPSADNLGQTLAQKLRPDVAYSQYEANLGFVHRHTDAGEIYFMVNTGNTPVSDTPVFRVTGLQPEWWDPTTGRVTAAKIAQRYSVGTAVAVNLAPYEAQMLVFTNRTLPAPAAAPGAPPPPVALDGGWDVTFKNASSEPDPAPEHLDKPASWTDNPATQYFSGTGTYITHVDVPAAMLQAGFNQVVDFGEGEAADQPGGTNGMHANYQPPVGDAAVVYVNGQRAGAVWCPPYRVDVSGLLKPGTNEIRIEVANRAINYMADFDHHPLPDYTELNASPLFGGNRFQPQDLNRIQTMPAGILGAVQIAAIPAQ